MVCATWREISLALYGLDIKNNFHYELARRVASAVVYSGMNRKLAFGFDRFFPPFNKENKSSGIPPAAIAQLRRLKTIEAQKNAAGITVKDRG